MTPAQQRALAVALDGLREAFGDEARAAIVRGLYDAGEARRIEAVLDAALEQEFWALMPCYCSDESRCDYCALLNRLYFSHLSPPETPTATPAHRPTAEPQAPSGETEQRGGLTVRRGAPVCSHCRDDDAQRLDCRACGGTGLADLDDIRPDAVTP